jgi:hypothetical protein
LYGGGTYNRNIIVRGSERCNRRGHAKEILFLQNSEKMQLEGAHSRNTIFAGFKKM